MFNIKDITGVLPVRTNNLIIKTHQTNMINGLQKAMERFTMLARRQAGEFQGNE